MNYEEGGYRELILRKARVARREAAGHLAIAVAVLLVVRLVGNPPIIAAVAGAFLAVVFSLIGIARLRDAGRYGQVAITDNFVFAPGLPAAGLPLRFVTLAESKRYSPDTGTFVFWNQSGKRFVLAAELVANPEHFWRVLTSAVSVAKGWEWDSNGKRFRSPAEGGGPSNVR